MLPTSTNPVHSTRSCRTNDNIVDIIREQLDEADSNQEFYATYTDCAKRVCSGNNYLALLHITFALYRYKVAEFS